MSHFFVVVVLLICLNTIQSWANSLETRFILSKIISKGDVVSDKNPAKPGLPVLLKATLTKWNSIFFQPLPLEGKKIFFLVERNGHWTPVPDDGITTTSDITNKKGVGSVYYLPPEDISSGSYRVKVFFGGDEEYDPTVEIKSGLIIFRHDPGFLNDDFDICGPNWLAKKINNESSNNPKIPLILIHGNNSENKQDDLYRWNKFKEFVDSKDDFNKFDIYVWKHDTSRPIGFNGYTGNAKELSDFIYENLLQIYPEGTKVLFVAHSRGGLVARSFMNYNKQGDDVLGLITLGTPHHGSPLAIPDWSALVWKQQESSRILYDFLVSNRKLLLGLPVFRTDVIGSLNLAWDNLDNSIPDYPINDEFNVSFANEGQVSLRNRDTNQRVDQLDPTIIYSENYKMKFGTLAELNQPLIAYADKIVAFAAYDDELTENPTIKDFFFDDNPTFFDPLDVRVAEHLTDEHYALSFLCQLMSYCSDIATDGSAFYANDGEVPLQSALLLDLSKNDKFSEIKENKVVLINIDERRQIKKQYIFKGDHLDLLDTQVSDYWETLKAEILDFTPPQLVINSPLEITSPLPYQVNDELTAVFSLKNEDPRTITLKKLTVGGRYNGATLPDGNFPDFEFRNDITLNPGQSYTYNGNLTLTQPGNYHFFCTYQTPDDKWNTNIDLAQGLTVADRERDILVTTPVVTPPPSPDTITDISLLRSGTQIYLFKNGKRYRITDAQQLQNLSQVYSFADKDFQLSSDEISSYPLGPDIVGDGLIIKSSSPNEHGIYLIQDGKKRLFSEQGYLKRSYSFTNDPVSPTYVLMPSEVVNSFPDELPIQEDTKDIDIQLSFRKNNTTSNIFAISETKESSIKITRGDGYTVNTYLKVIDPSGKEKYAHIVNENLLEFAPSKRSLTDALWNVNNIDWIFNCYTFPEDSWIGKWTWKYWYEDVNQPGEVIVAATASYNIYSVLFKISGGLGDDIPSALVHIPNGGEVWQAGTTQRITWSASDDGQIESASLLYSLDDGQIWQDIITLQHRPATQYFWTVPNTSSTTARIKVIVRDEDGNKDIDQSDNPFTIAVAEGPLASPNMLAPSVLGRNYNIAWQAVDGAQNYLLHEDTDPSFPNPLAYNTNLTAQYFTGRADNVYYYRVSAVNSQGHGAWSATKYIVVADQPPGEITDMSPANGATNQPLSVTVSWNSTHPAGESIKYNVWFASADVDFFNSTRLISAQQTETSYTVQNLPYGATCSWRIEAIGANGRNRESLIYKFTTIADNTPPSGGISINEGASATTTYSVALQISATDPDAGVGWMRLSNDGSSWTYWMNFSSSYNWNIANTRYGGKPNQTTYTVYAQFKDKRGNESPIYSDTIEKTAGTPGLILLNGEEYATIRDAVAASTSGDTIFLTQGVYTIYGELNPPRYPSHYVGIVMKPGVTLMGAGADKTTLNLERGGLYTLIDADNCTIEGLTIINSDSGGSRECILMESSSSRVAYCTVRGATSFGISIANGNDIKLSNNLIIHNGTGINNRGNRVEFYNNTIAFNSGDGVASYDASAVFKNNIIASNNSKGAVVQSSTVFQNNNVYGNSSGNYHTNQGWLNDQTGTNGNISSNPFFSNAGSDNYQLNSNSPCINAGTNVGISANGTPDIGAFEYDGTGIIQVPANQASAGFTITGPTNYTDSGTNWSVSSAPIGIYSISFSPVVNHNTPRYTSKLLQSGETLVFNGNYSADQEPPEASISVNFSEYTTPDSLVLISITASDEVAGMGTGAQIQFSNDGSIWSALEPFSTLKKDWNLKEYGGNETQEQKTVYAKISDALGNFTEPITDIILYAPNRHIIAVPDDYSSIQEAVNAAQLGDMVWVAPGDYNGDLALKSGVCLQGSGPALTTLNSADIKGADDSIIDGFTMLGGYQAVRISSTSPIISNNIISAQNCFIISGDSRPIIRNNIIDSRQIGIYSSPASQVAPIIQNNTIYGNDYGILINGGSAETRVVALNNIVSNNLYGIEDGNTSDLEHTHVSSSFNLFWTNTNGNLTGTNKDNIISIADQEGDPRYIDSANGDFSLLSDSPAINAGNPEARYNDVDGTQNDIGASGGPSANTAPVADFAVDSRLGGVGSEFVFDASTSVDRESATERMNFRWDWDEDGVFDTPFSSNPRTLQSFPNIGEKSITLQVRDGGGFVGMVTKQVTVQNRTPDAPSNPTPADGARGVVLSISSPDTTVLLQWTGRDADAGDAVHYDLFFGAGGTLTQVASDLTETSYTANGLTYNTLYSWRVDAIDNQGARIQGPTWVFVTEPEPLPSTPENLNATTLSYQSMQLSWGSSPLRTLGYRIERKTGENTDYTLINVIEADATEYTDQANLVGLTDYQYRLSALNTSGRSAYSNEATSTTDSDRLGDVNNNAGVNITDALIVATYDIKPDVVAPNNGALELGDVNYSDNISITDALIIATYDIAPDNPNLPAGIAESIFNSFPGAFKSVGLPALSPDVLVEISAEAVPAKEKDEDVISVVVRVQSQELDEKLGALSGKIEWDPAELIFLGHQELRETEFAYIQVADERASDGELLFNAFDAQGVGGEAELLQLRFQIIGEKEANPLKMELSDLAEARTFRDLMPAARITVPDQLSALPEHFVLYQNYPNPFNPQTFIRFDVPKTVEVRVELYNLLGQRIRTLVNERMSAGSHRVLWDGQDEDGRSVGSGVYFVRMAAQERVLVKKMAVVK